MADEPPKAQAKGSKITRTAIMCAMGVLFANAVFFVLSYKYFKAHATDLAEGAGVGTFKVVDVAAQAAAREAFLVLSLVTGAAAFVASRAPREVGHAFAILLGLASLAASFGAFSKSLPMVMPVTLLVVGFLMPTLSYFSWQRSRAAWAFLIALVAVFGGVDLFGAPKVRVMLGVGLWTAMVIPALQGVTVFALASMRREYNTRS
jgi:hypothetical protein